MARGERQLGRGIDLGVIGKSQRHRILPNGIGQLVDAALHGEAGGVLEGRAHITRRLNIGAHQALMSSEIGNPMKARAGSGVFPRKQIMTRGLGIDLVDRSHHLAAAIGAKPDAMTARRAEARVVENLGTRHHQLHRTPSQARGDSRQNRLHLQGVLLAESAAGKGRDDLHLLGREAKRLGKAMTDGFGVLSAFVNDELAVRSIPRPSRSTRSDSGAVADS